MRILEPPGRNVARTLGWISSLWDTDTRTKRKGQSGLQSGEGDLVAEAVAEVRWHVIDSEVEEVRIPRTRGRQEGMGHGEL